MHLLDLTCRQCPSTLGQCLAAKGPCVLRDLLQGGCLLTLSHHPHGLFSSGASAVPRCPPAYCPRDPGGWLSRDAVTIPLNQIGKKVKNGHVTAHSRHLDISAGLGPPRQGCAVAGVKVGRQALTLSSWSLCRCPQTPAWTRGGKVRTLVKTEGRRRLIFYLKSRVTHGEREIEGFHWYIQSPMATTAKAGPGPRQKPGTLSTVLLVGGRDPRSWESFAAFPGALARSWIGIRADGSQTGAP